MCEQEDFPPPGCAGVIELERVTPEQVMDVIRGRRREDGHYRNACQWGLIVFDAPDFTEDMPIDAKQQLLELVARNPSARYQAIYNHLASTVQQIVKEES